MTGSIINLIEQEMDTLNKEIGEIKHKRKSIQAFYEHIKKKFKGNNGAECICELEEKLVYGIALKVSTGADDPIIFLINQLQEWNSYKQKMESLLSEKNIPSDLIKNPDFLDNLKNSCKSSSNLERTYRIVVSINKTDEKLESLCCQIGNYVCERVISDYEEQEKEIDEIKRRFKILSYSKANMLECEMLSPSMAAELTLLINDKIDDENEKDLFAGCINNLVRKNKVIHLEHKKVDSQQTISKFVEKLTPMVYCDADGDNNYINHYLMIIRSLGEYDSIKSFLDTLNLNLNVELLIKRIIKLLKNVDNDNLIKSFLEKYLDNIQKKR